MRLIATLAALALAAAPALAQQAQPPAADPAAAQPASPAAAAPAAPAPVAPPQPQAAAPAAPAAPAPATTPAPAPAPPAATAAVQPPPPAEPGPPDLTKGVHCVTLSQQFGDTLTALTAPTVKQKPDEAVVKSASEQAGAGRKACIAHDYDAGLDQLRQAIGQLGKKAIL